MRPRDDEYRRFIHLVDLFRETGWNPARQYAASPFRVADVATNAVLLRAERDLLALAARFGTPADSQEIGARIERRARAIGGLWDAARGLFLARDLVGDAPIRVSTSAGFLPLYAAATTPEQTASLAETYAHWARACAWMIPSTDPTDPAFEPKRYWRGPIWSVVNWMIADGFAAAGRRELAALIRAQTCRLTERSGLSEYFDPTTGEGLGGAAFSWTAAVDLLLRTPAPA
jgi:glycogen debranching enzyme